MAPSQMKSVGDWVAVGFVGPPSPRKKKRDHIYRPCWRPLVCAARTTSDCQLMAEYRRVLSIENRLSPWLASLYMIFTATGSALVTGHRVN